MITTKNQNQNIYGSIRDRNEALSLVECDPGHILEQCAYTRTMWIRHDSNETGIKAYSNLSMYDSRY